MMISSKSFISESNDSGCCGGLSGSFLKISRGFTCDLTGYFSTFSIYPAIQSTSRWACFRNSSGVIEVYYFTDSARRMILFALTSITPLSIMKLTGLLSLSIILTGPASSVDIMGAWSLRTWKDPFFPGTLTDFISPSYIFLSGVMNLLFSSGPEPEIILTGQEFSLPFQWHLQLYRQA